jgi:phosphate transport system substrate-binding protein
MAAFRHLTFLAASAAGAFLLLLAPAGARAEDALRVSGTGSALGAMRRLSIAFQGADPGGRIQLLASLGSGGALKAVAQGALDVGLSGRALKPEEQALGLVAMAYARTPFVFAVGPRTGIVGITAGEAARIYRGEMQSWPNGERVRLVLRPRADVDTLILSRISTEMAAAVEAAQAREGMLMAVTNQECNDILVRTPGAIGPTSLTQILTEDKALTPLTWNGVAPTLQNLASGAYPLVKTHFIVVRASPSPAVRRFVAFLGSPEARRILEQTGNLPVPLVAHD